jgi:uncharacterized protein involved in cysteine biosynthesis
LFRALALGFAQLSDPATRRLVIFAIAASIALMIGLLTGLGWLLLNTALFDIGWLDWTIDALGGAAALVLAWLLFPGVLALVNSLLLERVAALVDRRYYPSLPPARQQPVMEAVVAGLRLVGLTILLNLLALPAYLFLPGVNLFLFYGINGFLLGREYFELVAVRRMPMPAARDLRRRHRLLVLLAGAIIVFMTTVPILNLVMPIVATAFMTHLLESLRRPPASA